MARCSRAAVVDSTDTGAAGTVVAVVVMADSAVVTVGTFDTGHIVADRTVAAGLAIDTLVNMVVVVVVVVAVAVADASTSVSLPDLQLLELDRDRETRTTGDENQSPRDPESDRLAALRRFYGLPTLRISQVLIKF